MSDRIVCAVGCCPGCQDCYGMSIGCHQSPYAEEDADPKWRDGCERHDGSADRRHAGDDSIPEDDLPGWCPICMAPGPCSEDDEGRPLWHVGAS